MLDVSPFVAIQPAPLAVFEAAASKPDQTRFQVAEDGELSDVSWSQFADQIAQVSRCIGPFSESRAIVFGDNSVAWAAAALAIQVVGGVMVPVYGSSTAEQFGYVAEHSAAEVVCVGSTSHLVRVFAALPGNWAGRIILLDESIDVALAARLAADNNDASTDNNNNDNNDNTFPAADSVVAWTDVRAIRADWDSCLRAIGNLDLDKPALMLYTSGSTGQPKGVPLTHNNIGSNSAAWMRACAQDLHPGGRDLLWLPMSHIFGFGEMCLGNVLGFETTLCSPKDAIALLEKIRPTIFFSVPAYWEKIARAARRGDSNSPANSVAQLKRLTGGALKFCLSGGAGLSEGIKELFWQAGILIVEGYGLTECSPTLTLNRRSGFRFDSVGSPLDNVEIRLAKDGEIEARGPNVFSGYHRNPTATAEVFSEDGWFRTGDLGAMTDDGYLQIVGRKKDILVTAGGKNVAPTNIELRFANDPDIEHVVVYGDGKKYLVAGVWLTESATAKNSNVKAKIEAVNRSLSSCETIKKFRVFDTPLSVEGGTLTASLKLRRKKVYEQFGDALEELYAEH